MSDAPLLSPKRLWFGLMSWVHCAERGCWLNPLEVVWFYRRPNAHEDWKHAKV